MVHGNKIETYETIKGSALWIWPLYVCGFKWKSFFLLSIFFYFQNEGPLKHPKLGRNYKIQLSKGFNNPNPPFNLLLFPWFCFSFFLLLYITRCTHSHQDSNNEHLDKMAKQYSSMFDLCGPMKGCAATQGRHLFMEGDLKFKDNINKVINDQEWSIWWNTIRFSNRINRVFVLWI